MNKIVDDILDILQANDLIQNTRVVNYDETPSGKLEAKLRSQLPKNHTLQIWIHIEPESLVMRTNYLQVSRSCAGIIPLTTGISPPPNITSIMKAVLCLHHR